MIIFKRLYTIYFSAEYLQKSKTTSTHLKVYSWKQTALLTLLLEAPNRNSNFTFSYKNTRHARDFSGGRTRKHGQKSDRSKQDTLVVRKAYCYYRTIIQIRHEVIRNCMPDARQQVCCGKRVYNSATYLPDS